MLENAARPERAITDGLSSRRRPSICYVVPGHRLLPTAGPTRNVLGVSAALSRYADVAIAFRNVLQYPALPGVRVLEIDGQGGRPAAALDDAATRDLQLGEFVRYVSAVRSFARRELARYDVVFEKSWTLSGLVAAECRRMGIPALVLENLVPMVRPRVGGSVTWMKRAKLWATRTAAGYYLRKAERVVAETNELKEAMIDAWKISAERIDVVGLGVDRTLFRPKEQGACRRKYNISPVSTVLLYSGIIDRTHNLCPVVEAICSLRISGLELHVIGDGPLRPELEERARAMKASIFFHGRVPHEAVSEYIAAADLCLAPYDPGAFAGGKIAYSSLKVPEYISAGRAVVAVPSGRMLELVEDGVTGFLFDNSIASWTDFLQRLPSRERLAAMGEAASQTALRSWDDMARDYLRLAWPGFRDSLDTVE